MEITGGWRAGRATWQYRRQGNRDIYLKHADGAQAVVYPTGGEIGTRCGPFRVLLPGDDFTRNSRDFPSRREALCFAIANGVAAYEGALL